MIKSANKNNAHAYILTPMKEKQMESSITTTNIFEFFGFETYLLIIYRFFDVIHYDDFSL